MKVNYLHGSIYMVDVWDREKDEEITITVECEMGSDCDANLSPTPENSFTTIDIRSVTGPDDKPYELGGQREAVEEAIIEYYDEYGPN